MKYEFPVFIDLGKSVDKIGELVSLTNDHLAKMGITDRLAIESEIGSLTITTDKEFSSEEEIAMRVIVQKSFDEKNIKARIGSPRRKPGKSCNQSAVID